MPHAANTLELVKTYPVETLAMTNERPLLLAALQQDCHEIENQLERERQLEVALDTAYWQPLREELSRVRRLGKSE